MSACHEGVLLRSAQWRVARSSDFSNMDVHLCFMLQALNARQDELQAARNMHSDQHYALRARSAQLSSQDLEHRICTIYYPSCAHGSAFAGAGLYGACISIAGGAEPCWCPLRMSADGQHPS